MNLIHFLQALWVTFYVLRCTHLKHFDPFSLWTILYERKAYKNLYQCICLNLMTITILLWGSELCQYHVICIGLPFMKSKFLVWCHCVCWLLPWMTQVNLGSQLPYGYGVEIWLFPKVAIHFYPHDFFHLYASLNYWLDFHWKMSCITFLSRKIIITYYRSIGNYHSKKLSPRYFCLSKSVSLRPALLLLKQEINKC